MDKRLLIGPERICRQIAYVLDYQDYEILPKLITPPPLPKAKIVVCEFKAKSKKLVKIKNQNLDITYLDDICAMLDREYGKGKPQPIDYNFKRINQLPVKKLTPSELLIKVIYSKPTNIICDRLETSIQITPKGDVRGCCNCYQTPFGNLINKDLDQIYNSSYARIIKLSSLNNSYCLCDLHRCNLINKNNLNHNSRSHKHLYTASIPQRIQIAIDKSCNLCCKSCRNDHYKAVDGTDQALLKNLSDKITSSGWLDKTQSITMAGSGEIFYSPTMLNLMLNGNSKRKEILVLSNGILFNEDNWNLIKDKYETISVSISIDAATPETYAKLRSGGNWQQLMKNMEFLSQLRKENAINYLQINFVVQRDNYHEMIDFIKLGQKLGVDRVKFAKLNNWGTYTENEYAKKSLINNKKINVNLKKILKDPIFKLPIVTMYGYLFLNKKL